MKAHTNNVIEMENVQVNVNESKLATAVRCTLCLTIIPLIYFMGNALMNL